MGLFVVDYIMFMDKNSIEAWLDHGVGPERLTNRLLAQTPKAAIFMAGVPGSGRTEYATHLLDDIGRSPVSPRFVFVDADQLAASLPKYRPSKHREYFAAAQPLVDLAVSKCLDRGRSFLVNDVLAKRSAHKNIRRSLRAGYKTIVIYVKQAAGPAWSQAKKEAVVAGWPADVDRFIDLCQTVNKSLSHILMTHHENPDFSFIYLDIRGYSRLASQAPAFCSQNPGGAPEIHRKLQVQYRTNHLKATKEKTNDKTAKK